MKKTYLSNSPKSERMFRSNILEKLSKIHFAVPMIIYIPVIGYLVYSSFNQHIGVGAFLFNFFSGFLTWSLTEYILHRYVFHFEPTSKWGQRLHFIFHGVHHDYPNDAKRLVMPPSASIPLALLFYFLFSLLFVTQSKLHAFYSGFILGYLLYDMIHYAIHHLNFKSGLLKQLRNTTCFTTTQIQPKDMALVQRSGILYFNPVLVQRNNMDIVKQNSFRRFSVSRILMVMCFVLCYLVLSYVLVGFKSDQLILSLVFCSLYFYNYFTRKMITGFSIFIIYWIIFDYMKAFPNYKFNTVHIGNLYEFEKNIFGIRSGETLLTPNEFFSIHSSKFLDLLSGFFYLCWIPVPLLFAAYLFFRNKEQFFRFSLTFVLANFIGFIGYYSYPAAPPWYIHKFGTNFYPLTPGNAAGLERFDSITWMNIFKAIYSKSSNVFAAVPSLHSAYPVVVFYYGLTNRLRWVNIIFAIIMAGIWFSAVYNNHHYIVDVLLGIGCAGIAIFSFNWLVKNTGWADQQLKKLVKAVE